MTLIATHCVKDMIQVDGMDVASEAIMAIEALFLLINSEGTAQKQATMKTLQVFMKMRCFIKVEHVALWSFFSNDFGVCFHVKELQKMIYLKINFCNACWFHELFGCTYFCIPFLENVCPQIS